MVKRVRNDESQHKLDRKTVERNRRIEMKELCSGLSSIVPSNHLKRSSKETTSKQHQLDNAVSYIKHLKERVEKLEKIKQQAQASMPTGSCGDSTNKMKNTGGLRLPVFEIRDLRSAIEVSIISGLQKNFMLCEVISVLQQEGAEVVSANFATVGDKIFHSIHAQVRISRLGVDTTRVCERLQELIS